MSQKMNIKNLVYSIVMINFDREFRRLLLCSISISANRNSHHHAYSSDKHPGTIPHPGYAYRHSGSHRNSRSHGYTAASFGYRARWDQSFLPDEKVFCCPC